MGTEKKHSRVYRALSSDIKNKKFSDVYEAIFKDVFNSLKLSPDITCRPKSEKMLTKNKPEIFHKLECAFWINRAAHLLRKEFTSEKISQEEAFLIKGMLLTDVLQELVNNPEKYAEILPSWGKGKDSDGKDTLLFDILGHGQIPFHIHKLSLLAFEDKIPQYAYTYVGPKETFPDGKNSKNKHDQLVADKRCKDLVNLGTYGNELYTFGGIDIEPLYCTCIDNGKSKIKPYSAAIKSNLSIDTIFGGVVKGKNAYFLAIPEGTPSGELRRPFCYKALPSKSLDKEQPNSVMAVRIDTDNHLGYQPPGSNIFLSGLDVNNRGMPFFTFKSWFFGQDNNRSSTIFNGERYLRMPNPDKYKGNCPIDISSKGDSLIEILGNLKKKIQEKENNSSMYAPTKVTKGVLASAGHSSR